MRRDHAGFMIFLVALLIAPKLSLDLGGVPGKSAVSLGSLGLLVWVLFSPEHVIYPQSIQNSFTLLGLTLFSIYALLISLASFDPVSSAYAIQYLIYLTVGSLLISGYVSAASAHCELQTTRQILVAIGVLYSVGVLVSIWTGPFYPHQTHWTERHWVGLSIQQGVGFADGTNGAAAILLVFVPFLVFAYDGRAVYRWSLALVAVAALLSTLSRGALAGLVAGVIGWLAVLIVRIAFTGTVSRSFLKGVGVTAIIVCIAITSLPYVDRASEGLPSAVAAGLGLGHQRIVFDDFESRLSIWHQAIAEWVDSSPLEQLLGVGFRRSLDLNDDALTWQTAHNAYLAILADFGVIGLVLFLIPLLGFMGTCISNLLVTGGQPIVHAGFISIVALLVHNLTEVFFYSPVLIAMVVILFSLTCMRDCDMSVPAIAQR